MRRCPLGVGLLLGLLAVPLAEAAKPAPGLPALDSDNLTPGQFIGTIVSVPNTDRMFTLKITYPEVRLKKKGKTSSGTGRMPNVQSVNRQFQNIQRLQKQMSSSSTPRQAINNISQMQQAFMQIQLSQQRMAQQEMQLTTRIQQQQTKAQRQLLQQELKVLQQQIKAIQNTYQVVNVTRNFDFQADENLKVRIKDLPKQFDDKGKPKKYTPQELAERKGKDKNLIGYESSPDALQIGQVVLVTLREHKKPKPSPSAAVDKDKDKDKDAEKEKDPTEHKLQVRLIVILQDVDTTQNSTPQPKKNN